MRSVWAVIAGAVVAGLIGATVGKYLLWITQEAVAHRPAIARTAATT